MSVDISLFVFNFFAAEFDQGVVNRVASHQLNYFEVLLIRTNSLLSLLAVIKQVSDL